MSDALNQLVGSHRWIFATGDFYLDNLGIAHLHARKKKREREERNKNVRSQPTLIFFVSKG